MGRFKRFIKSLKLQRWIIPIGQKHSVGSSGEGSGDIVSRASPIVCLPEDCISKINSFTSPPDACVYPNFDCLPEDCISKIISFTSPRDAGVSATVSKTLESAVNSNNVWEKFLEKFLPPEYYSLIPQSRVFSSKKELYFALCDDHILIEEGKKSFWLEKKSGKICIMLPAKELSITGANNPDYWRWISVPDSRFEKVAELINVWWFEIIAYINIHYLSFGTRYAAYIVFKKDIYPGFEDMPIEAGIGPPGQEPAKRHIYFVAPKDYSKVIKGRYWVKPKKRADGWMEAELGEFFVNETCCKDLQITILENKHPNWKRGLTIQGIEFRPTR